MDEEPELPSSGTVKRYLGRKARVVRRPETCERTYHWKELQEALGIPADESMLSITGPLWASGGVITVTTTKPAGD